MAAVSQKIPTLVGGVSQQPDSLKLPGQLRECINYYPDPTFGLVKRPGLRGIRKLDNTLGDGSWFVAFRDDEERYVIQISKLGQIRIWDAESGIQQTVNAISSSYAAHIKEEDIALFQINDYIFVLNRGVVVQASSGSSAAITPYGFVNVNSVAYKTEYKITLNTTDYTYTTPGATIGHIQSLSITNGGNGYTTGTYTNVPLINKTTSSNGTGAKATVVVNATGNVSSVTVTTTGINYLVGDQLEVNASTVGGTGTNAKFEVTGVQTEIDPLTVELIVTNLVSTINTGGVWTATGVGNSIHIQKNNSADFSIQAIGGTTGNALEAFKGSVPAVGNLPQQFLDGKIVKITASEGSQGDDYYVVFETSDNSSKGAGSWTETLAPGTKLGLNATTMPHAIIREANGTFTFRELSAAAAGAITPTSNVTGVPTAVSITSNGKGKYVLGQSFPVYGGTGLNLRLRVTSIQEIQTPVNYAYPASYPTNYVEKSLYPDATTKVTWYLNGQLYRESTTDSSFTVNNTNVAVYGSYTLVTAAAGAVQTYRAGITVTTTSSGVVSGVEISRAGRGYTASNVVTSADGDTFTITAVATVTQSIDYWADNWWQDRKVGDSETNPDPSFVGTTITGMSFFKNRLVLLSNDNVVCSQAGSYFDFFASTVITLVGSDPIDLSCGSLRPIELRHAIQVPRGLALFADNAQYVLETTTDPFSSSSAEINLLSNYDQDPRVSPVDTGQTIAFMEHSALSTSVYEMLIPDTGTKPQIVELTRIIPTYLPADIANLKVSTSAFTFAVNSKREPKNLYLFRYFNSGGERTLASWFKWTMPGEIVTLEFEHDKLYVVTKTTTGSYLLSHMNLLTDSPGSALYYEGKYIDLRLDLFTYNPTLVYNSLTDTTRVCFADGFNDSSLTPCVVTLNPQYPGIVEYPTLQYDATSPVGQKYYVTVEGNQTAERFALGYKYSGQATLPAFFVTSSEGRKDTLNIPIIHRLMIDSYESGPYEVTVTALGRNPYTQVVPQTPANLYQGNTLPILRNAQNRIPVMAKGSEVDVTITAPDPLPTAVNAITWEGTFNNRGIKSL
jgi:hypothetical protein